jgi:hypothetical protein
MAINSVTARITSKDIYIEFLPCSLAPATHIQHLYFDSAVDGGDFKLWYNGEETAAITMTGTAATDIIAINAALDALENTTAGDLVASGTVITDITITATGLGDGFVRLELVDGYDTTLTQSVPNSNPKVISEVTTQGSDWVRISTDITTFNWEETAGTVDVTAISEVARTEIPVDRTMSATVSLIKIQADSSVVDAQLMMYPESWGVLRVYPEGKIVGKEFFAFRALCEGITEDYPDHEKVEQEISVMRQSDWINRPKSIWRG